MVGFKILKRRLNNLLRPICDELHVPWRPDLVERCWQHSARGLGLWPRAMRDALPGDPDSSLICGAIGPQADGPLEPALEAFLSSGSPPVLVSLGTTVERLAVDLYDLVVDLCGELGQRVVLLGTRYRESHPTLPEHASACAFAPHPTIMPRCRILIHHGGIGCTLAALRAGRPTLIIPFAHDQFDNADRARRLGLSLTLRARRVDRWRLKVALRRLLAEETFAHRAETIAAAIAAEPCGEQVAADALEALTCRERRHAEGT